MQRSCKPIERFLNDEQAQKSQSENNVANHHMNARVVVTYIINPPKNHHAKGQDERDGIT